MAVGVLASGVRDLYAALEMPGGVVQAADPYLPFVGRGSEHRRIMSAWGRAQREGGCLVLVTGLPGIDKTRLVQQIADGLSADPAPRVLWMSCYEAETNLPFAPPVRLLAPWLERPPTPGERRRLDLTIADEGILFKSEPGPAGVHRKQKPRQ